MTNKCKHLMYASNVRLTVRRTEEGRILADIKELCHAQVR